MNPNLKPSSQLALLAVKDPISQAAATVTTDWLPMSNVQAILAVIQTGVMGAGATIDAKLREAKTSAGGDAADITGKAITQLVKASNDNDQVMLECRSDELSEGFSYVQLSITVANAACLLSAQVWGFYPRYEPAAHLASVVEVVA